MFGLGKSRALVGLDIGSSSVKAVELGRKGNKYEVLHLAVEELAPGAIVEYPEPGGLRIALRPSESGARDLGSEVRSSGKLAAQTQSPPPQFCGRYTPELRIPSSKSSAGG